MSDSTPRETAPAFPTRRAWYLLINHNTRLAQGFFAFFIASIFLAMPGLWLSGQWGFLREGCWVKGTVTGKQIATTAQPSLPLAVILAHGGGKNRRHYLVDYEFVDLQGRARRGSCSIEQTHWLPLVPGALVDVVYRESNPDKNRLWFGMSSIESILLVLAVAGTGALLFGTSRIVRGCLEVADELRLLREGTLTQGVLSGREVIGASRKSPGYALLLHYEFTARQRWADAPTTVAASYQTTRHARTPEKYGKHIAVVYDPENPDRSIPDVFQLRSTPASFPRSSEGAKNS